MHRVGSRSESNAFGASVGSGSGLLTVHHVGCDSQERQGRTGVLVNGQLLQLFAEVVHQVYTKVVYTVVVVAEARERTFDVETFRQADVVTACRYFGVFDGRQ